MQKLVTLLAIGMLAHGAASRAEDSKSSPYPVTICVVSGEPLGSMGKAYIFTYEGTEVQLCCKRCRKKFDADPQKYLKEIEAAQKSKAN